MYDAPGPASSKNEAGVTGGFVTIMSLSAEGRVKGVPGLTVQYMISGQRDDHHAQETRGRVGTSKGVKLAANGTRLADACVIPNDGHPANPCEPGV